MAVGDQKQAKAIPIREAFNFVWEKKSVYGALVIGPSLLAVIGYGTSAWLPEMFIRGYEVTRLQASSMVGTLNIICGIVGIFIGPMLSRWLEVRGYKSPNVRAMAIISALATIPAALYPLMPTFNLAWVVHIPASLLSSAYIGIGAASIQLITPNQLRGQVTALYLMFVSIWGLALGTSLVALFTNYVFGDESMLNYSLAVIAAVLYPIAAIIFYRGIDGFDRAYRELHG